ncbi:alkaline shock response membrane anchor protein AmaP [Amycolatopsis sp. OK19-0408]|uniref:Alkaline shock response membrane anchor protein AmaP n=1 Tax=Amycolatopsis iheyensis TaxID=2945988 RepID=A0A9X2SHV9_9PSEU|nr:alkaline shock response membrane anchor protein AmaP [Amycolatopsis iheyensis]MCR6482799.1 alkaline shock response membrane anchor protein AmaP [Amycolatopsis iheyensis]
MNRPARLNRVLLAILGLLLLAAGLLPIAIRSGWLPVLGPDRPLVPGTALPPTWVLYAAAVAGLVVALAGLRWLAAQLTRRPRARIWRFDTDPATGSTELSSSAAAKPFVEEVRSYQGVHDATAVLLGNRAGPALEIVVSVEHDGDPADIRTRIRTEGVPRLRQALDLDSLPARVELRFTAATGARVS